MLTDMLYFVGQLNVEQSAHKEQGHQHKKLLGSVCSLCHMHKLTLGTYGHAEQGLRCVCTINFRVLELTAPITAYRSLQVG